VQLTRKISFLSVISLYLAQADELEGPYGKSLQRLPGIPAGLAGHGGESFSEALPRTPAGGKLPPAPAIRAALHAARLFIPRRSGWNAHFVAPNGIARSTALPRGFCCLLSVFSQCSGVLLRDVSRPKHNVLRHIRGSREPGVPLRGAGQRPAMLPRGIFCFLGAERYAIFS
jgi:hypothetical protein